MRWQFDRDHRGATGRTVDLQPAINGLDALREAGQASARLEPGAACAVVADSHRHEARLVEHLPTHLAPLCFATFVSSSAAQK